MKAPQRPRLIAAIRRRVPTQSDGLPMRAWGIHQFGWRYPVIVRRAGNDFGSTSGGPM